MQPLKWFFKRHKVGMSSIAETLLDYLYNLGNTKVMIFNSYANEIGIASPATIHREIKWLIDNGYVRVLLMFDNKRDKYLDVTDKAVRYLKVKDNG